MVERLKDFFLDQVKSYQSVDLESISKFSFFNKERQVSVE